MVFFGIVHRKFETDWYNGQFYANELGDNDTLTTSRRRVGVQPAFSSHGDCFGSLYANGLRQQRLHIIGSAPTQGRRMGGHSKSATRDGTTMQTSRVGAAQFSASDEGRWAATHSFRSRRRAQFQFGDTATAHLGPVFHRLDRASFLGAPLSYRNSPTRPGGEG